MMSLNVNSRDVHKAGAPEQVLGYKPASAATIERNKGDENVLYLVLVAARTYTFVKTYQTVPLKWVHFIASKLYLNNVEDFRNTAKCFAISCFVKKAEQETLFLRVCLCKFCRQMDNVWLKKKSFFFLCI